MAEKNVQTTSSGMDKNIARRGDLSSSRDWFGFSPFAFSPFSMIRRFNEELDRAFSNTFGASRGTGDVWAPPIEVRQKDGDLEISAELPGMSKDDVKVECTEQGITIEGEKKQQFEKEEGGMRRSERTYGHFYRLIPLPEGAEVDKAKADFRNGVLQVHVPVPQDARNKPRQIPIGS